MPSTELFRPQSDNDLRAALRRQKEQARTRNESMQELAIDYLEGRAIEDVRHQLQTRYKQHQSLPAGERIEPLSIPLAERYASEAASLYNNTVERKLIREDGAEDKEATKALVDHLTETGMDERMHRVSQIAVSAGTCCVWPQAKRGKLRLQVVVPQRAHPVAPINDFEMDPADQEDYLGHVVSVTPDTEDTSQAHEARWVMITPSELIMYQNEDPYGWTGNLERFPSPYEWPQVPDSDDNKATAIVLPLQMLCYFHKRLPVGELILDVDPDMALMNRELNVAYSVLLDTIRTQGWGTLALTIMNPDQPRGFVNMGSRFALPLDAAGQESAQYLTSPVNYGGLVDALNGFVRMLAVAKRQSPNDFSTEQNAAESGFAKQVMSLPKMEAREELAKRFKATEENVLWPRIGAILEYLGIIKNAAQYRMKTNFSEVEFPRAIQEETQWAEHSYKWGLSSPAEDLAKEKGITVEDAQTEIDERKARGKGGAPEDETETEEGQAPQQPQSIADRLASVVGRRDKTLPPADERLGQ